MFECKTVITDLKPRLKPWAFFTVDYNESGNYETHWEQVFENFVEAFSGYKKFDIISESNLDKNPEEMIDLMGQKLNLVSYVHYTDFYGIASFVENIELKWVKVSLINSLPEKEKILFKCLCYLLYHVFDKGNDSVYIDELSEIITETEQYSKNEFTVELFSGHSRNRKNSLALTKNERKAKEIYSFIENASIHEVIQILEEQSYSNTRNLLLKAAKCYSHTDGYSICCVSDLGTGEIFPVDPVVFSWDFDDSDLNYGYIVTVIPLHENVPFQSPKYKKIEKLIYLSLKLLTEYERFETHECVTGV